MILYKALLTSNNEFFPVVSTEVSFSLQKANTLLVLAKLMQGTSFLHKVCFKGIFKCINSSFRDDFANCSAACILEYEQVHWLLFVSANQGRNELSRFGEMFPFSFYHVNLLNNSKKPQICKGCIPVASAIY